MTVMEFHINKKNMTQLIKDILPDHRELRGHDRMVVGFKTTYDVVNAYHH
jgi:hypothetical protein